ncbi:maleylacetoacetate isomerase [Thecamonas trahens ATCC 50062]|uniref:Maleylacetoacetate isomerase n=1 Tax=Thecamonas trahens ATCC 50062 TaxID=461836 RepID=A0A0L0DGU1_THETB|nr:maleylacetoacetate isomerase [Thecamonas trahens ATCC 50062]KNC51336.1 maleylacetoacetate isomerase [Thecamonas trahens ATCC 50062]|eukprot:XP_013756256.1 maleylacetoacetate isomerase [Thecamonas trahens ATCC 50062]
MYSYWRSSCSYRVRIALAHKSLAYTYHAVSLLAGEQTEDGYTELNPSKLLPALVLADGTVIGQSTAILEFLEEAYPDAPKLLPEDPLARAYVRQAVAMIAADIQPVQNLRVLKYVGMDRKIEWGAHWIATGFDALEAFLAKHAGNYCIGDELSLADACLVPQVYNARRFGIDVETKYPIIARIDAALNEIEAFKAAHPDNMPDAQVSA